MDGYGENAGESGGKNRIHFMTALQCTTHSFRQTSSGISVSSPARCSAAFILPRNIRESARTCTRN